MSYVSKEGIVAGPLKISSLSDSNGTWLVQDGKNLHFVSKKDRPSNDNTHNTILWAKTSLEGYDDVKECQNMVATVGWVMQNFKSENLPTFSPNDYITIELYDELKARIVKTENNIASIQIQVNRLETKTKEIDTNKEAIKINANNIQLLRNDFTNYVESPFPNGVIFVAGGAEVEE